jgi:hypothetical protein
MPSRAPGVARGCRRYEPIAGCAGSDNAQDLSHGAKVDMGGWSLYIQCKGTGSPTFVLDAGLDNAHTDWKEVEPAVAQRTRTCSYDRSGVGMSDIRRSRPAVVPAEQVVEELHNLLAGAEVSPPYARRGGNQPGRRLGEIKRRAAAVPHDSRGSVVSARRDTAGLL